MARPAFWRGYLKLSLVTAAVTLTPATTESRKVRFHILNRATGNRVTSRYVDSITHRAVADRNQVRGYPKGEDDYVLIEDEEIDALGVESTRTIDIDRFVPADAIDWLWYERPHFMMPADKVGMEAFAVIRAAMEAKKVAGLSRLVLYGREHPVALEPCGKGIVVWTLHYADELREAEHVFNVPKKPKKDAAMDKLVKAEQLDWAPSLLGDPVQHKIEKLLSAKTKKQKKKPAPKRAAAPSGKVINLMDALKKSLASEKRG